MARQITVVTPENIPLTLELAGLGTRFGALLFDFMVQFLVAAIVGAIGSIIAALTGGLGLGNVAMGLMILGLFVVFFGYFIFFEAIWNGQTPGKRVFKLRVVRDGGFPVNFFAVAARNLVRLADFMPLAYCAGAISVFFNTNYKRLGDLVGGTIVIKERDAFRLGTYDPEEDKIRGGNLPPSFGATTGSSPASPTAVDPVTALSPAEVDVLRTFTRRRYEMASDDSERLAYRLVAPLVPRLGITFLPGVAPRYADLASAIVAGIDAREVEAQQNI